MSARQRVAVFVLGKVNTTRVTVPDHLSDRILDFFASSVARMDPARTYYIYRVAERTDKRLQGLDPLYVWYVGDGFDHSDGWWVKFDA